MLATARTARNNCSKQGRLAGMFGKSATHAEIIGDDVSPA
jgi:hypothetical protein